MGGDWVWMVMMASNDDHDNEDFTTAAIMCVLDLRAHRNEHTFIYTYLEYDCCKFVVCSSDGIVCIIM